MEKCTRTHLDTFLLFKRNKINHCLGITKAWKEFVGSRVNVIFVHISLHMLKNTPIKFSAKKVVLSEISNKEHSWDLLLQSKKKAGKKWKNGYLHCLDCKLAPSIGSCHNKNKCEVNQNVWTGIWESQKHHRWILTLLLVSVIQVECNELNAVIFPKGISVSSSTKIFQQ